MPAPVPPTVPPPALRSDPATFKERAEANVTFFATLVGYMNSVVTWIVGQVEDITAIAMAGDLPSLTGRAGTLLRVKADETGLEFLPTGTTGRAVLESESDAEAQSVLGLLSAATKDAGTAIGEVPVFEDVGGNPAYPAGVGSQLTDVVTPVKAWVNFNGTGTVAIRNSLNVSSITDNGTGDYTLNFENELDSASYTFALTGNRSAIDSNFTGALAELAGMTTTSLRIVVGEPTAKINLDLVGVTVIGG